MSESNMEKLKNKIRSTGASAVHAELIDTANTGAEVQIPRRAKKKKFEELYRRDTVWIKNELKDRLDELSFEGGRGEKTRIVNEAFELYFKNLM
ncbi:hypothetical protein [Paenibacillus sp. SN-8-1]|uniref:hypothetical protein n=1 Tax=Paenibacillus sp. SN-8-1 TaxID=3435409 RepID=UPI003D9A7229